jgi:hypothetical protein
MRKVRMSHICKNEMTRGLPGKYVDTFSFPDGRFEVRWKGVSIPYAAFDKDQRVTHAAITENKHLSVVLEHIKAEQVKVAPKKRRAGKQATRYQPTGKRNDGWNSKLTNELRRRPRNPHHAPHNDPDRMAGQGCDV